MKILLIDADSKIPNIALMKLSTYHKAQGDTVELLKLNLPYYPNKKRSCYVYTEEYDRAYCSLVFNSEESVVGQGIIYGGTGVSLTTVLAPEIDRCTPDYSLYPDNDISYGFITRGCIRKCPFCVVPEKEGYIHQVHTVDEIVRHKKVKFMDNNFLALPNHIQILQELIEKNIRCSFIQGLDIRLVTEENTQLIQQLKYMGEYIFAFDSLSYMPVIVRGLGLLSWRKPWQLKFYVYVNKDMPLSDFVTRVDYLRGKQCLPYFMRDINCWYTEYEKFYTDMCAWCNQPSMFKKMTFPQFMSVRHTDEERIERHIALYVEAQGK
jgi:hypothetical protein